MGNYFDQFDAPKSEGNYFDQFDAPKPGLARRALDAVPGLASDAMAGINTGVNYLGTQAIKAASNVGGMMLGGIGPGMHGLPSLAHARGQYPSGPEISQKVFDVTGAPEVNAEGNIPGGKYVDAAVQGALTMPLTGGGASLPAFITGAAGGLGSEAAGNVAHEYFPKYETAARVLGSFAGGGLGAGASALGPRAVNTVKALATPFSASGREGLVGTALREAASNPDAAINGLDKFTIGQQAFPNAVPGFQVNAGKAAMDPGLMAAADTLPDKLRGATMQQNNGILTSALDRQGVGLPPSEQAGSTIQNALGDRFEALKGARSAAVDPLYTAARANPNDLVIGPIFKTVDDAIATTKGDTQAALTKVRGLLFNSKGQPDWSPAGAMQARSEVNGMLESPSLPSYTKSLLMDVKGKLDASLASVPEAAQANATFARMSKPLDPFSADLGNKSVADVIAKDQFGKGYLIPSEKVASQFIKAGDLSVPAVNKALMAAGNDPSVKAALGSSYLQSFRDAVTNNVQKDAAGNPMMAASPAAKWLNAHSEGAAKVLTPDQMSALKDISDSLSTQAQAVPGRVGSPTFDRLATNSILSAMVGPKLGNAPFMHSINKALGFVYGGSNEAAMNKLYEALADPAIASALMKKATPGNVKMATPVLARLGALGPVSNAQAAKDSP